MMKRWCIPTMLAVVALTTAIQAGEGDLLFSYQGRVKAQGVAFNGTGQFKFSIYTKDGSTEHVLWVNDGYTTQTEPTNPVLVPVASGVFTVLIGDTSVTNMAALEPAIFNIRGPLFLRTWFSDGMHGFEALSPDSPITNAGLLGREQRKDLTLYVNDSTGNDHWSGLTPSRAKKTIQGAINALPSWLEGQTLILVADGFYPETVRIQNIQLGGGAASLTVRGNLASPSLVRLSGADSPGATTATRARGLEIINQAQAITVEGFQIDYCTECGILADRATADFNAVTIQDCVALGGNIKGGSSVTFHNGKVLRCERGLNTTGGSQTSFYDSEVATMTYWGVMSSYSGQSYLYNTKVHHTGQSNVVASTGACAMLSGCELYQGGTGPAGAYYGARADASSVIRFIGGDIHDQGVGGALAMLNSTVYFYGTATTIRNNPVGIDAHSCSLVHNQLGLYITFSGNVQDVLTDTTGFYLTTSY